MKILLAIITLFVVSPIIYTLVYVYLQLWKGMIDSAKSVIHTVSYKIPTIHLRHDDNTGNSLIWDNVNKVMYGHPEGVEEIEEE